jgi:hypothetical protein
MWVGIPDEAVAADIVLPEQFRYVWHHSSSVSGERALAVAVLTEALHDLVRYRFAIRLRTQRLYWQAYAWIMADDTEWPFAFVNLCDTLGVDVARCASACARRSTCPRRRCSTRPPDRAACDSRFLNAGDCR